jgi:hypothetical protein
LEGIQLQVSGVKSLVSISQPREFSGNWRPETRN